MPDYAAIERTRAAEAELRLALTEAHTVVFNIVPIDGVVQMAVLRELLKLNKKMDTLIRATRR